MYPFLVGVLRVEVDGGLKVDFFDVATSVTGRERLVTLLRHHGSPFAFAGWTMLFKR
jgi:hypothetical protein